MKELFKYVEGYEGIYQISNYGALLVSERTWKSGRKGSQVKHRDAFLMKPKADKAGYVYYELYKDGSGKKYKAHRLVALAFIPNPLGCPQVNHKNGVKDDNRVENLEWATSAQNVKHGFDVLNRRPTWSGTGRSSREKAVLQVDLATGVTKEYFNSGIAATELGVKRSEIFWAAKRNNERHGYTWSFK